MLLGAAVLGMVLPATATGAGATSSCAAAIDRGGVTGDLLLAVTGAPDHATAVGVHYIGGDGTPLVTRWTGSGWARIRVPVTPGAVLIQFQAAATAGPRSWAVGAFRNDRPEAGFVEHGVWHWTQPIDPGPQEDQFLGVAAMLDGTVWAVGKHQDGADYQPLVERFDGTAWHVVTTPSVVGSAVLNGVAVAPDGSVYAVGWRVQEGGRTVPLVERWDRGIWSVQRTTGVGLLSAVAIEPDGSPLAVGWRVADAGDEILTMRDAGGTWAPVPDATGDPGRLQAIAVGEATIAAGFRSSDGIPQPLIVRLDGGWTPIGVTGETAPESGGDQLLGLTGELDDYRAVGIRDEVDAFGSLAVAGTCTN
jgi:hypothetical protein